MARFMDMSWDLVLSVFFICMEIPGEFRGKTAGFSNIYFFFQLIIGFYYILIQYDMKINPENSEIVINTSDQNVCIFLSSRNDSRRYFGDAQGCLIFLCLCVTFLGCLHFSFLGNN